MRDDHIDLCGQVDFTRTEAMPLLGREAQFCFACAGCGDCCRGREDIVLSGFDRGQPQHRQMAHLPDAGPAIAPGHDLRRQAQPGCNAPQVKA